MEITAWIANAVFVTGISWRLLLGVIGAEADYNVRAEHWGYRTADAIVALNAGDDAALRSIIASEWPDISFGPGQRIIPYHYYGDQSRTLANILAVRSFVFANPERDILEMSRWLVAKRATILAADRDLNRVNYDLDLATAISYNRGSYPYDGSRYWVAYSANVARFQDALAEFDVKARQLAEDALRQPYSD
jgi:hypothetical protein